MCRWTLYARAVYAAARRLLVEIDKAGMKFAFHSWGTALEVIAAAHLGVCWEEQVVEWLEYPCYADPRANRHVSFCAGR